MGDVLSDKSMSFREEMRSFHTSMTTLMNGLGARMGSLENKFTEHLTSHNTDLKEEVKEAKTGTRWTIEMILVACLGVAGIVTSVAAIVTR